MGRQMIDNGTGQFTVTDSDRVLATEVSRVAAYEFVHATDPNLPATPAIPTPQRQR
jgi:hypothetical protein